MIIRPSTLRTLKPTRNAVAAMSQNRIYTLLQSKVSIFCWLALAAFLSQASLVAQQVDDLMPLRGVYPNGSYTFDKFENINNLTGTLSYAIPITALPLGRAGMTVPVNVYYSAAYGDPVEYSATDNSGTKQVYSYMISSQWGGWRVDGFNYSLYVQSPTDSTCNFGPGESSQPPFTVSIVMPDGAHHVLNLYGQSYSLGPTFWFDPSNGTDPCNNVTLPSPLTYYTDDGSYIRVSVDYANHFWTAYLPDGTTVTNPWGIAPGSTPPPSSTETIQDRNGNKVTVVATFPVFNYTTNQSTQGVVLTDDLGRFISISTVTTINGPSPTQQKTTTSITQAGFNGTPLVWTLGGSNNLVVPASCGNQGPIGCGSYQGGGPTFLQIPSDTGNLQYSFSYDSGTGAVNKVTLPSGATTSYTYSINNLLANSTLTSFSEYGITQKQVSWIDQSDNGSTPITETWNFAYNGSNTQITHPDGGLETVYFDARGGDTNDTVVRQTEPDGSGTEYLYYDNRPYHVASGGNPYVYLAVHTVASGGSPSLASVEQRTLNKNGILVGDIFYDWIPYSNLTHNPLGYLTGFSPGTVLRSVSNTYSVQTAVNASTGAENVNDDSNAYWNPSAPRLLALRTRSVVNGAGTGAVTEASYDSNGNPLQESHWDSTKAPSQPACASPCLNSSNANITARAFDTFGNVTQVTDPNGNVTKFTFDPNNLYAILEQDAYNTSVARTFQYVWDFSSGLLTSQSDSDNNVTNTYSYDPQGRQTQTVEASSSLARQTNTTYDDANRRVILKRDQLSSGDGLLTSIINYDQLYRVTLTQDMESSADTSGIKVQTRYLASPPYTYTLVSNPYRAATSNAATSETTMGWTLKTSDQNGRLVAIQSFTGSGLPAPWGGNAVTSGTVSTSYDSNTTTVVDQAGNTTSTAVDGSERIVSVTEYPGSGSYVTAYGYDALDDLISVNQSGLFRSFTFDSLKRKIASTNPENYSSQYSPGLTCSDGLVYSNCYYYDSTGNLVEEIDNRNVGVSYAYDALNRLKSKTYVNLSSTSQNAGSASYSYDDPNVPFSRGRLTATAMVPANPNDRSITNYLAYDALGRITSSSQTTAGNTFTFGNYSYTLTGALTSVTYPSGRVVLTCYDGANRVSQVGGSTCANASTGSPVPGAYASNFLYAAHGEPNQFVYGNTVWHTPIYNSRLQMSEYLDLRNNSVGNELIHAYLTWGQTSTTNNGNLSQAIYYHGDPNTYSNFIVFTDTFGYDGLNRLNSATDSAYNSITGVQTGGWSRGFGYDAYGNMTPSGNPDTPSISFNGNNQIAGQNYDQAGNQQTVNGNALVYDFENHIVSEIDGQSPSAVETYVYDADGRRVQKYGPGYSPQTIYVYGATGELAAEYSTAPNNSPCATCYLSADQLGTTRLVTDQNGLVVARHDYLPFGEEVAANRFGRDNNWGPGNDNINQKFTGKERDTESALDYFDARYYGSAIGRFTSPDNYFSDACVVHPQQWNRYSYVAGNPLNSIDPSGHFISKRAKENPSEPPDDDDGPDLDCLLAAKEALPGFDYQKAATIWKDLGGKQFESPKAPIYAALAAVTWQGESSFSGNADNKKASSGADIGPMQINSYYYGPNQAKNTVPNIFGSGVWGTSGGGQQFNGDPNANIAYATAILANLYRAYGDRAAGKYVGDLRNYKVDTDTTNKKGVVTHHPAGSPRNAPAQARQRTWMGAKQKLVDFFSKCFND